MTKKYYYDCPIQALYMHVNFGVKFPTELKFIADLSTDNFSENMTPDITKIYVKPESEHIFQPRKGDFVAYQIGEKIELVKINRVFDLKPVKITYREGKNFFSPKEEN